jgi:broad specificity phosphatase PhoE
MSDHFKINDGPVACFIGAKGSVFDLPTTKRAYTYAEQPGNVVASKLGRALETAARCSASDSIDAGLVLLKALQAEGFGVFQLGAEYTVPPRQWQTLSEEEIYPLYSEPSSDAEMVEFARAVEEKLRAKNSTLACIPAVPPG